MFECFAFFPESTSFHTDVLLQTRDRREMLFILIRELCVRAESKPNCRKRTSQIAFCRINIFIGFPRWCSNGYCTISIARGLNIAVSNVFLIFYRYFSRFPKRTFTEFRFFLSIPTASIALENFNFWYKNICAIVQKYITHIINICTHTIFVTQTL